MNLDKINMNIKTLTSIYSHFILFLSPFYFIYKNISQYNHKAMDTRSNNYDFVVVGGGTFGISTALYLNLQYPTAKCALIEQFKFGHGEGSSHSQTRIIRSTYSHPFYRDLCLQGMAKHWPEVQTLLGQQFIVSNPFMAFVKDKEEFKQYKQVANTSKNIQEVTSQEARRRYPFAPYVDNIKTVFIQQKAGIVLAERYVSNVIKYLKTCKNIEIIEETQVLEVSNNQQIVKLQLRDQKQSYSLTAKKVSLSCGRWINRLVPQIRQILKPVRQTITYWKMKKHQLYKLGKYPAWIYHEQENKIMTYSLPDATGDGIKFACHSQNPDLQGNYASEQDFVNANVEFLTKRIHQHYRDQVVELSKIQKCYYTVTKTEDFLIDWTDQHENILICSPCSGHGFKFGPIIGKIVADLLKTDTSIQIFEQYRYLSRLCYHQGVNLN